MKEVKFYFRAWEIVPGFIFRPVMTFSTNLPPEEVRRRVPKEFLVFGPYNSYQECLKEIEKVFERQEMASLLN